MRRILLFLMLIYCALLGACKPEDKMTIVNVDDVKTDITEWPEYFLGFNSMRVPPGFTPTSASATVDWHEASIIRNYSGSARSAIEAHERFGGVVFQTRINDWDFVVAKEQRSRRVSDKILVFFGARKFGDHIFMFTQPASKSKVGDGSDPKYRQFYETLNVELQTEKNRKQGFYFEGYVFTGYTPQNIYSFDVGFLGAPTDDIYKRSSFSITLSPQKDLPKDDRPLAPGPTFADYGIKAEGVELRKSGRIGGLIRLTGQEDDEDPRRSYRVFIDGVKSDITKSKIYIHRYENVDLSFDESEKQVLDFLNSIQSK